MLQALRRLTAGVVTLIALSAAGGLAFSLAHAASLIGWWLWPGAFAAAGLAAWSLRRQDLAVLGQPAVVVQGLLALLALRTLAAVAIDAPLISDFKDYHDLALGVLDGGPWLQEGRPMGYPLLLAAAYALGGPSPVNGELLNVALGVVSGGALWLLVRRLAGAIPAGLAVSLFALWPAHALMTPVIGTEVAYACLFLLAMAALTRAAWAPPQASGQLPPPGGAEMAPGASTLPLPPAGGGAREGGGGAAPMAFAALAGALTGLAQYVRPTTLALVPAALLWLAMAGRRPKAAALLAGLYLAGLLLVLAPVAEWNHRTQGRWSLSTSSYGGWSLLVGMNQRHHGMWNVDDAATADRMGGLAAVDAYAKAEGLRRMTADPLATASLLARKFPIMWSMEDFGTYWAVGTGPKPDPVRMAWLTLAAQAFYAAVTAAAAWALWRRRDWDAAWTPLFAGLLLLVGVHALLEVQGRYHFYWTPVFIAFAAMAAVPGQVTPFRPRSK